MFRFPWTNEHELNLDWIVRKIKELNAKVLKIKIPEPYNGTPEPNSPYPGPGTSDKYARGDHSHPEIVMPQPSSYTPQPLGTPDPGSSYLYSRGDHVHPLPSAADVGAVSKWTLLWTNPDPSIDFGPDTVNIDLSNYDAVMVVLNYSTTNMEGNFVGFGFINPNGENSYYVLGLTSTTSQVSYLWVRRFYPSPSGIEFSDCTRKPVSNTAGTIYNSNFIPAKIYAAKIF